MYLKKNIKFENITVLYFREIYSKIYKSIFHFKFSINTVFKEFSSQILRHG